MKENLLKIINHYGVLPQLKHFNSEVFELTEAIVKHEALGCEYKHITEELADCLVMIDQFRLYYDIDIEELKAVMEFKIDRQLDRMKEEK